MAQIHNALCAGYVLLVPQTYRNAHSLRPRALGTQGRAWSPRTGTTWGPGEQRHPHSDLLGLVI